MKNNFKLHEAIAISFGLIALSYLGSGFELPKYESEAYILGYAIGRLLSGFIIGFFIEWLLAKYRQKKGN